MDIGCGEGALAQQLQSMGKSVVAVEFDEQKAAKARSFCRRVIVGNVGSSSVLESLQSLGQRYDLIVCSEVLEHLADPVCVLKRLARFLKAQGAVVAVIPNVAFYKTRLMLLRGRWDYADQGILDRTHLRFFTRKTVCELFSSAGYTLQAVLPTHYSRRFSFLYDRLIHRWPALFGEQFVVRALLK